jgi:hypothetical protein
MIGVLIALHPKRWRNEYGDEYRALIESSPLTAAVVLDVLRNAVRLHLDARPILLRCYAALALSAIGETIAGVGQLSDNILWIPSSPSKAIVLAAVLLPWVLVFATVRRVRLKRRLDPADGSSSRPSRSARRT